MESSTLAAFWQHGSRLRNSISIRYAGYHVAVVQIYHLFISKEIVPSFKSGASIALHAPSESIHRRIFILLLHLNRAGRLARDCNLSVLHH